MCGVVVGGDMQLYCSMNVVLCGPLSTTIGRPGARRAYSLFVDNAILKTRYVGTVGI